MVNSLGRKLKGKEVVVGGYLSIGHPDVSEVLSNVGFDFLTIDMEHSPFDINTVSVLLQTMRRSETAAMVRVAWNDIVLIKRALDAGADGIIVPMVSTKEEAVRAARAVRYPPDGIRGFGPRGRSLRDAAFAGTTSYIRQANRETLLWIQIETKEGVENIDEILSVPGIDAMVIGPFDLSLSLGVPTNWASPKFTRAVKRLLDSCIEHGIAPGVLAPTEWQKRRREGFRIFQTGTDYGFLHDGATEALRLIREYPKP